MSLMLLTFNLKAKGRARARSERAFFPAAEEEVWMGTSLIIDTGPNTCLSIWRVPVVGRESQINKR